MKKYKLKEHIKHKMGLIATMLLGWAFFKAVWMSDLNHWSVHLVFAVTVYFLMSDLFGFEIKLVKTKKSVRGEENARAEYR